MIIDHTHRAYRQLRAVSGKNRHNGAYYYSIEIVNNIIPKVKTDRNWITININNVGCDHAIVFIHNNKNPEMYNWLSKYKDLVLVCGVPQTMEKVKHLGTPIYLPLSIDVKEVEQYKTSKTKGSAYVGRAAKRIDTPLWDIDHIEGIARKELLRQMAQYRKVYAVGRCAIEAKCLGCEVMAFDPRYPDPSIWKVLDNSEAAEILQKELDKIDGES